MHSDFGDSGCVNDTSDPAVYEEEHSLRCFRVLANFKGALSSDLQVNKGELVIGYEDPRGVKQFVHSCRRLGAEGTVPKRLLALANDTEAKPWFVGQIARDDAEKILSHSNLPVSTFLVRESENTAGYVISYKNQDFNSRTIKYAHRKIQKDSNGKYCSWSGYLFGTLDELIDSHQTTKGNNLLGIPYDKWAQFRSNDQAILQHHSSTGTNYLQAAPVSPVAMEEHTSRNITHFTMRKVDLNEKPSLAQNLPINAHIDKKQPKMNVSSPIPSRCSSECRPIYSSVQPCIETKPINHVSFASLPKYPDMLKKHKFDEWYINPSKVRQLECLGSGCYGSVYKARIKGLHQDVAMKTLNPETMKVDDFLREAEMMKNLRHPNLVKLYGVCSDEEAVFFLLEYYPNGSVWDTFKRGDTLTLKQKHSILTDVAKGMAYLSSASYIHRDLAARNVLLAEDFSARVADFGMAQLLKFDDNETQQTTNVKMPWKWTAPEALRKPHEWSTYSDVWSYGIFAWELFTNCFENLYEGIRSIKDLYNFLNSGERLPKPEECHDMLYEHLLIMCWKLNATDRLSFQGISDFMNCYIQCQNE